MKTIYILEDIVHSGRKDVRGKPVDDVKYDGIIGLRVTFDPAKLKQFDCLRMYFLDYHRLYKWWDTSEIIGLFNSSGKLEIETANSIYKLVEWHDEKGSD